MQYLTTNTLKEAQQIVRERFPAATFLPDPYGGKYVDGLQIVGYVETTGDVVRLRIEEARDLHG